MYQRILLPLDLTEHHAHALERAVDIAKRSEAEIRLLHVVETVAGVDFDSEQDFYRRFYERSQEKLAAKADQLTAQGCTVEFATTYGNRGDEIVQYAIEQEIDLMIVSSPALKADDPRRGLASLSWKLGILAPCDVLLVK